MKKLTITILILILIVTTLSIGDTIIDRERIEQTTLPNGIEQIDIEWEIDSDSRIARGTVYKVIEKELDPQDIGALTEEKTIIGHVERKIGTCPEIIVNGLNINLLRPYHECLEFIQKPDIQIENELRTESLKLVNRQIETQEDSIKNRLTLINDARGELER